MKIQKIKVYLLDDHQMLLDGLKALVSYEADIDIAGYSTSPVRAFDEVKTLVPDVLICDINMPEMSGIDFTRNIKAILPNLNIVALSMFGEQQTISDMLAAGATGYILKNTGKEELLSAIRHVAAGKLFFSDEISVTMMKSISQQNTAKAVPSVQLTLREKEIVVLMSKEYTNAQIAEALFISERTVESHRKNMYRKTDTKTPVGLIKVAMEQKWI